MDVSPGMVKVVVKVDIDPGAVEMKVVPGRVTVTGDAGIDVVTTERIVDAGMIMVVPGCITVGPWLIIVVGTVICETMVVPGPTIVVGTKMLDTNVVPGSVIVVGTRTWVLKVLPGSVTVVGTKISSVKELITVEAGRVIVVKDPETEVVMVEAGTTTVVVVGTKAVAKDTLVVVVVSEAVAVTMAMLTDNDVDTKVEMLSMYSVVPLTIMEGYDVDTVVVEKYTTVVVVGISI